MKRQSSAGIVTFYKKDKTIYYLLLHYPGGHWDFPKGKMEQEETKEQTALRELKEETGLTADILSGFEESMEYFFRAGDDSISKQVTYFVGQSSGMEVTLSFEHQGYEWFPFDQAHEKLTYQNAKDILKFAHDFLKK